MDQLKQIRSKSLNKTQKVDTALKNLTSANFNSTTNIKGTAAAIAAAIPTKRDSSVPKSAKNSAQQNSQQLQTATNSQGLKKSQIPPTGLAGSLGGIGTLSSKQFQTKPVASSAVTLQRPPSAAKQRAELLQDQSASLGSAPSIPLKPKKEILKPTVGMLATRDNFVKPKEEVQMEVEQHRKPSKQGLSEEEAKQQKSEQSQQPERPEKHLTPN